MLERGELEKVADVVSRRLSVYGIRIDGYATPADLPGCPVKNEIEGCGKYIVLSMKVSDKEIQVFVDMERLLGKVKSDRYGIYTGKGTEVVRDYNIQVVERGVSPKALVTLSGILALSTYAFYKLLERFMSQAQHESALIPIVKMMEKRDPYTAGHSRRVARIARDFARHIGIRGGRLRLIYKAGLLHDIGKIGISEKILLKPGKLMPDEFEVVKRHPLLSEEILKSIPGYEEVARIVKYHHERCDGSGYPCGLLCGEIPLESRIIALADVYDALTSERAYRRSWTPEKALEYIRESAGKLFDPHLTDKFVEFMKGRISKYKSQTT